MAGHLQPVARTSPSPRCLYPKTSSEGARDSRAAVRPAVFHPGSAAGRWSVQTSRGIVRRTHRCEADGLPPEAARFPVLRRMAPDSRDDELGRGRGPTDPRARGGRGGDRYRRRVRQVHHFARQLSAPFPLLAAIGFGPAESRPAPAVIEAVREPAEHGGGRCRRRICSPAVVCNWASAEAHPSRRGTVPKRSATPWTSDDVREKTAIFRAAISGMRSCGADRGRPSRSRSCSPCSRSPRPRSGELVGSGIRESAGWVGEQGMHLMSSTLLLGGHGGAVR